jgi:hypothetical protein
LINFLRSAAAFFSDLLAELRRLVSRAFEAE